jgi:hypothetical protein
MPRGAGAWSDTLPAPVCVSAQAGLLDTEAAMERRGLVGGAISARMAPKMTLWTPQQFNRQAPLDTLEIVIPGEDGLTVGVGYHGDDEIRNADSVDSHALESKLRVNDLLPKRGRFSCQRKGVKILLEIAKLFWRSGSWDDFSFD